MKTKTVITNLIFLLANMFASAQKTYHVTDFGAKGDGMTVNTQSIQNAIDRCNEEGGGMVVIQRGTFISATLFLKSGVTLYLSEGAILKGIADMQAYKQGYRSNYAFIYAEGQENIAILGRGTIHGQGEHEVFQSKNHFNGIKNRPNTIFFAECKHIRLKDYTIRNGARWNMKFDNCIDIVLDDVSVYSRVVANNDGVDFDDCHNVRVSNCYFDTGDDGICAKSYSGFGVKNMVVTNCIIKSSSNGLKLGAVSRGSFEDITFSNCVIYNTRLSGIAIQNADGSRIERVTFTNITMHNVNGGIFFKIGARNDVKPGTIKDILVSDVVADGVGCWLPDTTQSYYKEAYDSRIGVGLAGQPGYRIENVQFNNIYMQFAGGGTATHAGIVMEDLPDVYPEYRNWGITPAYAFNCRHVKDIQFNNVLFDYLKKEERPAMFFEDAEGIVLNHVSAKIDEQARAFFRCKDVKDMFIHSNKPQAVSAPFLSFEGEVKDITIMNNDFHRIRKIFTLENAEYTNEMRLLNNIGD